MESSASSLVIQDFKTWISEGRLDKVLRELIHFVEGTDSQVTTEVYLTSARFQHLEADKRRGSISSVDYKLELNSITVSLLEILKTLEKIDPSSLKAARSKKKIRKDLAALAEEFALTDQMKSETAELRMKIHIARKMAEKLALWPELIQEYRDTDDQAIICAIGRKIKIIAHEDDLDVLESVVPKAQSHVPKGFLTNALAEFIYSGQLRLGDEERVREMLDSLRRDSNRVLRTNVERVDAMLDYLTGKMR